MFVDSLKSYGMKPCCCRFGSRSVENYDLEGLAIFAKDPQTRSLVGAADELRLSTSVSHGHLRNIVTDNSGARLFEPK